MQSLLSRSCRAIFVIEREMKRERVPVVFTGGAKFRSYWWKLARKTVVKIATSRYYTFVCIGIAYNFSNRRDYTLHRGYVLRFVYIDYRKSRGNSFLLSYNLANFIEENDPIFDQNGRFTTLSNQIPAFVTHYYYIGTRVTALYFVISFILLTLSSHGVWTCRCVLQ